MKKYVGIEFVEAEPCTSEEFNKYAQTHPNEAVLKTDAHWENEPGYMLFLGEKRAWLPAVIFLARFSEVASDDPACVAHTICDSAVRWSMVHALVDNNTASMQPSSNPEKKIFKFKLIGTASFQGKVMFVNGSMLMNIECGQVKLYTPDASEFQEKPVLKIDYSNCYTHTTSFSTGDLYFLTNSINSKPDKENMIGLVMPTGNLGNDCIEVLMLTPNHNVKVVNINNESFAGAYPVTLA